MWIPWTLKSFVEQAPGTIEYKAVTLANATEKPVGYLGNKLSSLDGISPDEKHKQQMLKTAYKDK